MACATLKVIFDRSAFHGERFELLRRSPLKRLCDRGLLQIFHTPVFLDETLAAYGAGSKAQDWLHHLRFAVDVCNGGVFLDKGEIWREELVMGRGPLARHLLPTSASKRYPSWPSMRDALHRAADTGAVPGLWKNSTAMREDIAAKKSNQKAISRTLREKIAVAVKERQVKGRVKDYQFEDFKRSEFVHTGRSFMTLVDPGRPGPLADQWARSPERFPFYSAFIEGVLYAGYYAMIHQDRAIDWNAQADFEQLAYLTWVDLVVSDDQKFLRSAFEALWKPRGKRLESSATFVALADRLA